MQGYCILKYKKNQLFEQVTQEIMQESRFDRFENTCFQPVITEPGMFSLPIWFMIW